MSVLQISKRIFSVWMVLTLSMFIFSCKPTPAPAKVSMFDTIIENYVQQGDSNEYFKGDAHYEILKKYSEKDTAYFIKLDSDLHRANEYYDKNRGNPGRCVPSESFSALEYDEAYKLEIRPSWYRNQATITIYKKSGNYYLHFIESGFFTILPGKRIIANYDSCKIFINDTIQIKEADWQTLLEKLGYADYWHLMPFRGLKAVDGSIWTFQAMRPSEKIIENKWKHETHAVMRQSPDQTALGNIGKYMFELSGQKQLFKLYLE